MGEGDILFNKAKRELQEASQETSHKLDFSPWNETTRKISCILPGELYLSGMYFEPEDLAELNIATVINITEEIPLWKLSGDDSEEKYPPCVKDAKRFPFMDRYYVNIIDRMDEMVEYIKNAEKPVLVHCQAGISRSSTVVLCYLIKEKGMTPYEAFIHVLKIRPFIRPNSGFLKQIMLYSRGEKLPARCPPPLRFTM